MFNPCNNTHVIPHTQAETWKVRHITDKVHTITYSRATNSFFTVLPSFEFLYAIKPTPAAFQTRAEIHEHERKLFSELTDYRVCYSVGACVVVCMCVYAFAFVGVYVFSYIGAVFLANTDEYINYWAYA